MKILSVLNPLLDDYLISGAARLAVTLANWINKFYTDIHVDFVANECIKPMLDTNASVYNIDLKSKSRYMKDLMENIVSIYRDNNYDILHIHIHQMSVLNAINQFIPNDIPIVYTQHSSTILGRFSLGYRDAANQLSTTSDRKIKLVMPSNAMLDIWNEYIENSNATNTVVIRNAVSDVNIDKYTDLDKSEYYVSCGRIDPNKGMLEVARFCNEYKIPVIIIGNSGMGTLKPNDNQIKYIEEFEKLVGESDCITWIKEDTNEHIRELMANARGYISFSNKESFGLTVAEALSVGTPVLYLEDSALKEVVHNVSSTISNTHRDVSVMIPRASLYRKSQNSRMKIYKKYFDEFESNISSELFNRESIIAKFVDSDLTIAKCADNYVELYRSMTL